MRCVAILGLGSRYSYLAATQLPVLEEEFGVAFDWWPIHSPDLIRKGHGGVSPFDAPRRSGQYDPAYRDTDARRWASLYNVPYTPPPPELLELRSMAEACWAYSDPAKRRQAAKSVFTAIFARGEVPGPELLTQFAAELGPTDQTGGVAHAEAIEASLAAGAFGVPTFMIGDDLFWGNDRLALVRQALSAQM